jgi:hypothetical protein
MGQPTRYTQHKPHTLELDQWGTFVVRPGDCVSKYHWAVFGNWGDDKSWRANFKQVLPGPKDNPYIVKDLKDPNKIDVGWRMTYFPKFDPPKKEEKPDNGTQPNNGGPSEPPVPLDRGHRMFDISREFAYQAVVPLDKPAYSKWFSWQWQIDVSGKIYQTAGPATVTLSTTDVKAAIDYSLKERFAVPAVIKTELSASQFWDKILPAYQTRDPYRFADAVFESFSLVLQVPPGGVTVAPTDKVSINNNVELSAKLNPLIPFYAGIVTTQTIKDVWIRGCKYTIELQGKGGLNFGPSPFVWMDLARKGGMFVLRNMARAIGTEVATALASEGALIAGAATVGVAYAAVLTYLIGWAYGWATEQGRIDGLATWYVGRYRSLVFGDSFTQPRLEHMWGRSQEEREEMLREAKEVVAKAVADCEKNVRDRLTQEEHPAASQDVPSMYVAYKDFLIMEAGGDGTAARKMLEADLEPKAKAALRK